MISQSPTYFFTRAYYNNHMSHSPSTRVIKNVKNKSKGHLAVNVLLTCVPVALLSFLGDRSWQENYHGTRTSLSGHVCLQVVPIRLSCGAYTWQSVLFLHETMLNAVKHEWCRKVLCNPTAFAGDAAAAMLAFPRPAGHCTCKTLGYPTFWDTDTHQLSIVQTLLGGLSG